MKKNNKKGFTVVELIAVLVILSIVMMIAFPSIRKIYYNNKYKEYHVYENMMLEYAKSIKNTTDSSCIYLKDLKIDKLDLDKGCNEDNSYVMIENNKYEAYLQCSGYTTGYDIPNEAGYENQKYNNCYHKICNRFEIGDAFKIDNNTTAFDKCCKIHDGETSCGLDFPTITVKDSFNYYEDGWHGDLRDVKAGLKREISNYETYNPIIKEKTDAVCPTMEDVTVVYDGKKHSIKVIGDSELLGGEIEYSTDNKSWKSSAITITDAGSKKIYIKVNADTKHRSVTCGYKTIKIEKADAICPTLTAYTGNYNGVAHKITVSGGSGGTIQYSIDDKTWSTTNPTRTDAGSQTTYVKVVGDDNHNNVSCGSKTITINKIDATCPTTTAFSGNYDGTSHKITVSGGTGGTIKYSSDNKTWSTTNPTRTDAGSQTTYVKIEGDNNHNTVSCTSRDITIKKVAATISCSNKDYSGSEQTACSCSGGTIGGDYKATNVGTYKASCTADKNHTDPSNVSWTMNKVEASFSCSNKTYNASEQVGCTCSGGTLGGTYKATYPKSREGCPEDRKVNHAKTTDFGKYTATCTPDANHTLSTTSQTWSIVADLPTVTYKVHTTGTSCGNDKYTGKVYFTFTCNNTTPHTYTTCFPTDPKCELAENPKDSKYVEGNGTHTMSAQCQNQAGWGSIVTYTFKIVDKCN